MSIIPSLRALFTSGRGTVQGLRDAAGSEDPFILFAEWFDVACKSGLYLPEAVSLATASRDAVPSVRMVLMKDHSEQGITFFTNYESRKAADLEENPVAALVFHWAILQRQVRFEGTVHRISSEESDAYFQTRAHGSKIGAWASKQSRRLSRRSDLEERVRTLEAEFGSDPIPLPPFWGGYRLVPKRIEFWQGRADRLHDRLIYERDDNDWKSYRVYP